VGAREGKNRNALLRLPFNAAYMFRPGLIEPPAGVRSKTRVYRLIYGLSRQILPVLRVLFPKYVTTSVRIGRVMIAVADRSDFPQRIVENPDINMIAQDMRS
jgi:hypothetical protein